MAEQHTFEFQDYKIRYLQIGHGKNLILAFHGFGMDRFAFEPFHHLVGTDQKLISIDLFCHGQSDPADFSGLKRSLWREVVLSFLNHLGHDKFNCMAYSLGGKVVLETVNLLSDRIDGLILFAPDGFKKNRFYEFISLSAFGRWSYRRVMNNPKGALKLTKFLFRLNLLPMHLDRFIEYYVGDKERRELVYDVYRVYRHFIPDLKTLQRHIEDQGIHITFVFGKRDKIIHHSLGLRFMDRLEDKSLAQIHLLDKGHIILDDETAMYLKINNLWFG